MPHQWLEALRAYFPSLSPGYNPFPAHRRQLARMCVRRGNRLLDEHKYDNAVDEFNKAIDWDPGCAEAFCNRACVYQEQAEYDLALADSNRAIQLNPDLASAICNRASVYLEKAEYDIALADSDRAIQLNPNLASAICNRGTAYLGKGDLAQAVSNYEHAMHVRPEYALPFANRGFLRFLQGSMSDAIKDCDRAVELDPQLAIAYSNRGIAAFCQADFEKAATDFALAAKQEPSDCAHSIWVYLANGRAGRVQSAYLEQHQSESERSAWPGPVLGFLLGGLTVDALLSAAQGKNAHKHQQQSCAALYFAGERAWLGGQSQQAASFFVRATELGATNCAEYVAAQSELRLIHSGISQ